MENNHPCFDYRGIREEYSERINNLFQEEKSNSAKNLENNIDWIAYPARYSQYVFIEPEMNMAIPDPNIKGIKQYIFPNVARIGVNTKEGIARLGMIVYPSINYSNSKKILEDKGYASENIDGQSQFFFLSKNLKDLESLVGELKDIESILLMK